MPAAKHLEDRSENLGGMTIAESDKKSYPPSERRGVSPTCPAWGASTSGSRPDARWGEARRAHAPTLAGGETLLSRFSRLSSNQDTITPVPRQRQSQSWANTIGAGGWR